MSALSRPAIGRLPVPGHRQNPAGRGPFVVVAGIPGAGKSTALNELDRTHRLGDARVADSECVRRSLQARLPAVPYRALRPLVHAVHWARIVVLAIGETGPVLVHETATRPLHRAVLLGIARLGRRPARMVWVDVDAQDARQGQIRRGRVIPPASFQRHLRRVSRGDPAMAASGIWDAVYRTDRGGAARAIAAACGQVPLASGADPPIAHVP